MKPETISYHIDEIMLWDYAKGKLNDGERLLVQTHLELCPKCAQKAAHYINLCGEMLEEIEGIELANGAFENILSRIDNEKELVKVKKPIAKISEIYGHKLPKSLQNIVIKERYFIAPGVWVAPVFEKLATNAAKAYLLFVKRGMELLNHSHSGREITLVLSGGFNDGDKELKAGDFIIEDETKIHAPKLFDDEDCLTLVYQDGPIKPKDILGHLIKPLAQI